MFGHLSQQTNVVTLAVVALPQPGTRYLLALGRNPDGTYGSGSEGLVYVDGETVAYADGVPFSTGLTGEEFVEAVRREAGQAQGQPGANASPVISGGAPRANLTYEGAVYYMDPLRAADAVNLSEDDFELVGSTTESNLLAPGSGRSLDIYRLTDGDEAYLYTLEPGRSFLNEDGSTITIEAEWVRWSR